MTGTQVVTYERDGIQRHHPCIVDQETGLYICYSASRWMVIPQRAGSNPGATWLNVLHTLPIS